MGLDITRLPFVNLSQTDAVDADYRGMQDVQRDGGAVGTIAVTVNEAKLQEELKKRGFIVTDCREQVGAWVPSKDRWSALVGNYDANAPVAEGKATFFADDRVGNEVHALEFPTDFYVAQEEGVKPFLVVQTDKGPLVCYIGAPYENLKQDHPWIQ